MQHIKQAYMYTMLHIYFKNLKNIGVFYEYMYNKVKKGVKWVQKATGIWHICLKLSPFDHQDQNYYPAPVYYI